MLGQVHWLFQLKDISAESGGKKAGSRGGAEPRGRHLLREGYREV